MLAIVYLAAATHVGDLICRRFFRFISLQHRIATSFLVGLLLSTWITFLAAVAFHRIHQPLMAANLTFIAVFWVVVLATRPWRGNENTSLIRPAGTLQWDIVWLAAFLLIACWLMFATLNFSNGQFQIAYNAWTDFGANVSLTQSFALGHNFPPQHPFFPGEFIRYHFLFWFQAANLEFLGLNPVWAINILSILSLLALLVLIMTFGEVLFKSRAVGRVAALFFFFSSSLSYLPFLNSQGGVSAAVDSIIHRTEFLASGYPFRGETWAALSANVFAYQRHLISGIAFLFVAAIFAVDQYQAVVRRKKPSASILPSPDQNQNEIAEDHREATEPQAGNDGESRSARLPGWIFCGGLLGLLPYWNSPTYLAALAIFGCLLLIAPLRLRTACMLVAAIIVGLPQVLMLRSGNTLTYSLFNPGYTLENATVWLVLKYLGWTFGVKWILLGVAVVFATRFQRRLLLALSSLVVIVFLFQLSLDVFNNHKLLNIWATFVNVYAAFALWNIWKQKIAGRVLAVLLAVATVFGGVVDLFPLHNDPMIAVPYRNDRLSQWLVANTRPNDIFLTHPLLAHPILFTGRKVYLGYTLFAWTAAYNVPDREAIYQRMFQEANVTELVRLLRENGIAYVAIDNDVRENETLPDLNESVLYEYFPRVFEDTEGAYGDLVIYQVPNTLSEETK